MVGIKPLDARTSSNGLNNPAALQPDGDRGLTVVDLFAGCGGFSEGFRQAGYSIDIAIEIDEWAADTYRENHPGCSILVGDIRDLQSPKEIRGLVARRPDVLIGGPPCQGFSVAGPAAKDPRDPRNSLFRDFLRFVDALQPTVVLMENVKGLLRAKTAAGCLVLDVIRSELEHLGYVVDARLLNAAEYGVPQLRERLFIVGTRQGQWRWPEPTHWPRGRPVSEQRQGSLFVRDYSLFSGRYLTLWEAISDLPQIPAGSKGERTYATDPQNEYQVHMRQSCSVLYNHEPMNHTSRLVERFKMIAHGQSAADVTGPFAQRRRNGSGLAAHAYDQNNRRLRPDQPSHTVAAAFYANFVHPYLHRNFTAREAARIQSFPDRYVFKGKKTIPSHKLLAREGRVHDMHIPQYSQIGNAVPPLLAKVLAEQLSEVLISVSSTART